MTLNKEQIEMMVKSSVQDVLAEGEQEYYTSAQLAKRWGITEKTLENWRWQHKPPVFIKIQASKKGLIRYPFYGKDGVLETEKSWRNNHQYE
nr:hypothetical protein 35 [bacterium]